MRKALIAILAVLPFIFIGCSADEPASPAEHPNQDEYIYLEFNKWIYAQMNRQYLWREDMPDSLDCDYDLFPKDFFESLLSEKDRFSYFTSNPSYTGRGQSDADQDYGFAYQRVRDANNNEALQVLYVTSANATRAGLRRGDCVRIKHCYVNHIALARMNFEDGVLADANDMVEFTIDDLSDKTRSVLLDTVYNIEGRNIGYMCYLQFEEEEEVQETLERFVEAGITDLILDLRYNPGGYVNTACYLCNCIIPSSAYGEIFQQYSYNDVLSEYYLKERGSPRKFKYYDYPAPDELEMLGARIIPVHLSRLYVITSSHTASASEATIVCLDPFVEVITIGEPTVGKGVGSWNISSTKYPYSLQPITMRYYNALGISTPDDGIQPDYYVPGGFGVSKAMIGDVEEPLLNAALSLILDQAPSDTGDIDEQQTYEALTPVGEPSFVTAFKSKPIEYAVQGRN